MNKIYKLLEMVYEELNQFNSEPVYIVPHDNIDEKVGKTYVTYKIMTNDIKDITQEQLETVRKQKTYGLNKFGENTRDVYRQLYKNYQGSISFNVISDNDIAAYDIAQHLHDILFYTLKEEIYYELDIVILDVSSIKDVSVRISDNYSYRNNIDVRFRGSRIIERKVGTIESAKIKMEVD